MIEFKTNKITPYITLIHGVCTECMYLVEGRNSAILIDTGMGFGDLKSKVSELTDKPVIVLLTHGHADHAMGAAQFENVYMNRKDIPVYHMHQEKTFREKAFKVLSDPETNLSNEDYREAADPSGFRELKEGDIFDLGNESIELYACPGHTPGTMVMLFKKARILLTGDACNTSTYLFLDYCTTVEEYENSLKRLAKKVEGKYDRILSSHDDGVLDINVMKENIKICEEIKNRTSDDIPIEFMGDTGYIAKKGTNRISNIVYKKERIYRY